MQLFFKILSGMAKSVDPDQTAPEGQFAYASLHIPFCEKLWCMKF